VATSATPDAKRGAQPRAQPWTDGRTPEARPAIAPTFGRLAARDGGLLALALGVWAADARVADATVAGAVLALLAGGLAVLCAFLVHEWGHWLGGRLAGATLHPPERWTSPFLFHFDPERSGRRAFLALSGGGFAASVAAVGVLAAAVPWQGLAGRVTLVGVALGVAATLVLEVPVAWRVARGAPLPRGGVYRSPGGGRWPREVGS